MVDTTFKRERRYIVAKIKDVTSALTIEEQAVLSSLLDKIESNRIASGKSKLECVVIESDWPNYDEAWSSVERVANNTYEPIEAILSEMADNAEKNGFDDHANGIKDAIQRLYDDGVCKHLYYCECDNGCGNSFKTSFVGQTCTECGQGAMQAQDVEPWGDS
ncbi:hypothetical protein [Vibrio cholerae]|uniref:hypothetical protein n=1 Tax=Vibrio cholerae TaxID=666 RepID=UPI0029C38848|nr:hypothetical protein [Vibrio cholerae]MDX5050072.1 hypothetical protein [Vibrio cholerae]